MLATTRPPTIEAKMSIGPQMICRMARQVTSRFDLLENPISSILVRRPPACVGFARGIFSTKVGFSRDLGLEDLCTPSMGSSVAAARDHVVSARISSPFKSTQPRMAGA